MTAGLRPARQAIAPLVRRAVAVPADGSLLDAARAMVEHGVDAVLVDRPSGPEDVLSEHDLVTALASCDDPASTALPRRGGRLSVPATASVDAVAALMAGTGRSHVLVRGGDRRILGTVSLRDVTGALLR